MKVKQAEKIADRIGKNLRKVQKDIERLGCWPRSDINKAYHDLHTEWYKQIIRRFPWRSNNV